MPILSWEESKLSTKSPRNLLSRSATSDSKTILKNKMYVADFGKGKQKKAKSYDWERKHNKIFWKSNLILRKKNKEEKTKKVYGT